MITNDDAVLAVDELELVVGHEDLALAARPVLGESNHVGPERAGERSIQPSVREHAERPHQHVREQLEQVDREPDANEYVEEQELDEDEFF